MTLDEGPANAGRDAIPRRRVSPAPAGARLDGGDVSARSRSGPRPRRRDRLAHRRGRAPRASRSARPARSKAGATGPSAPRISTRLLVDDNERDLLRWIADPDARAVPARRRSAWSAFRDIVKREYGIDVDEKGALQKAVERLIATVRRWRKVWNRLAEAPQSSSVRCASAFARPPRRSRAICCTALERAIPATNPHDNAIAEKMLAQDLSSLLSCRAARRPRKSSRSKSAIARRRDTLWARLGEAPLACALEPLARLAAATESACRRRYLAAIASAYARRRLAGRRGADRDNRGGRNARRTVARAPPAHFTGRGSTPGAALPRRRTRPPATAARPTPLAIEPGTMVLFVDGLRMDVGQRRRREADRTGRSAATLAWRLAPVPERDGHSQSRWSRRSAKRSPAGRQSERFLPLEASSGKPATYGRAAQGDAGAWHTGARQGAYATPEKPTSIGYAECGNIDQ